MVTKEQYGLWKHEPVTQWFFNYLANKQAFLKSAALDEWLNGRSWSETVRGQIIELEEMLQLPWDAVQEFYKEREEVHGTESESSSG